MHPIDRPRVVILELSGPFDDWDLAPLRSLVESPREAGCSRFVLNLREVAGVSDAILGYVLKTRRHCAENGGDLVFAEPSSAAREAMSRHGLNSRIEIFPDNRAALSYLRRRVG